ncbi:hypothetical protein WR25_05976 [Diploscapter pachys]|uniref:C2 domain-containing protein n=1 Tax=Diploscapter pachys TaxID=2018661 RepID=A0A2A2LQ65_9BILA|nr:hypothetical protein WR25_05976 [Diploscapter pachys]
MLIPICCERLPVRLEIAIISAKSLPIMDKSINSTDAFVELRYLDSIEKTDVVTSLNPVWNSDYFLFDTDEKELSEEWVQFRVMDHDTYSANDAIGRVNLDCNVLVERMRVTKTDSCEETMIMKIYDTLYGIRGELTFKVRIHLLMQADYSNYVQMFTGSKLPQDLKAIEIVGIIDNICCEKDPDFEWLDKIRTPRATNEARQNAIRETLREAAIGLAHKADKQQANVIMGYKEYVDMEGEGSNLITVRALGTAFRVVPAKHSVSPYGKPQKPVLTISNLPNDRISGIGSWVTAKAVQVLENVEEPEMLRKNWWNTLRCELYQQALSIGCNLVIGYEEQFVVHQGVAVISASGTAVVLGKEEEGSSASISTPSEPPNSRGSPMNAPPSESFVVKEKKPIFKFQFNEARDKRSDSIPKPLYFRCSQFHAPPGLSKFPVPVKCNPCSYCKSGVVPEMILSTTSCPPSQYYTGPRSFIQVNVTRKLQSNTADLENFAIDIGNSIPFADHDLIGSLLSEAKTINLHANAIFDLRYVFSLSEDCLVVVATGILLRLLSIPKADLSSPISNVLSFSSLQRHNDARRFSWGTVRDAMRFNKSSSMAPSITLKILNLKQPSPLGEDPLRNKISLNSIVEKVRRKQQKEYISHVVFERHLSLTIGIHEAQLAANSGNIAGVHLSSSLHPGFINKDIADSNSIVLTRFSDVFVREDLSNSVKDSTSVDGFVTAVLEERIQSAKSLLTLAGSNAAISSVRIGCPQFNVSKEHAHIILLFSFDLNQMLVT